MKDRLLLGDVKGAREVIEAKRKGLDPEQDKILMSGLKKSVLASRPISPGGSSSEARKANFMAWARKNLPKADQIRLKQLDDTYRNAAERAGLLKQKAATLREMQEDMRMMLLKNKVQRDDLD